MLFHRTGQAIVDLDDESIQDWWFSSPALLAMLVYWSHRRGTVPLKKHCKCALVAFLSRTVSVEDAMTFFARELPVDECECRGRREGLCEQRRIVKKEHRKLLGLENSTAHMKLSELLVCLYSATPCPLLAEHVGQFLLEIGMCIDGRRAVWGKSDWMHGEHACVAGPSKLRRLDPEIRQAARTLVEEGGQPNMRSAARSSHLPEGTADRFVQANVLEYQLSCVAAFRVAREGCLSIAVDAARLRRPGKEYLQGLVSARADGGLIGAATAPAVHSIADQRGGESNRE
eukprot:5434610-Amphidinium_carterae.1